MLIVRGQSRMKAWLGVDPKSGSATFMPLVQCLHERGNMRLKTFDSIENAELFIDVNPSTCIGHLEICEAHFSRDGMRVSVVKSLSR